MTSKQKNIDPVIAVKPVILDMSDCYTWSFPEFIPFCSSLFSISTYKDFNTFAQA
ncbi:MAG TPA: hypothetical protein VFR58_07660 [Flavisolibacter sp.]|nr:hypothetical protein [Flavisolibacter sp.]